MRTNEFHKPFIQSLVLVAIVTIFAMVSSKYVVKYYFSHNLTQSKTLEYSSQKSYDTDKSVVDD
jgi:multisubunit Na+/H+ antiporter MnhC subunit